MELACIIFIGTTATIQVFNLHAVINDYTRALHNAALNGADLGLALMTKSSWKFLHDSEPQFSADKNLV